MTDQKQAEQSGYDGWLEAWASIGEQPTLSAWSRFAALVTDPEVKQAMKKGWLRAREEHIEVTP